MTFYRVAHGPIAAQSLFEHLGEHRHIAVDVVHHTHFGFRVMLAVQAAGILDQRAFPRDRHGEEQGVETGVVEALSDFCFYFSVCSVPLVRVIFVR